MQWTYSGGEGTRWPSLSNPARLPGAINLNTVRHRGVLAGLIDDPNGHINPGLFRGYAERCLRHGIQHSGLVDPIHPITASV